MARPRVLLVSFVVLALALALGWARMQPPRAASVDAPLDTFSAGRALAVLRDLLVEDRPRPVGSAQNARVRERIVVQLGGVLGYEVAVQGATPCGEDDGERVCTTVWNVLARMPGREVGPALVLMAHYDSVPAGPGVADDGSGVATILELARIFQQEGPYRNPILLLFTDGEEAGLLGARAFLREHPWADEVGVVINLEARGSSPLSRMASITTPRRTISRTSTRAACSITAKTRWRWCAAWPRWTSRYSLRGTRSIWTCLAWASSSGPRRGRCR